MVVEKRNVGNDDDRQGESHGIEDSTGACSSTLINLRILKDQAVYNLTGMSNDHALERLALNRKTGPQLIVEAALVEVEPLDLQAETLSHGGFSTAEEV